MRTAIFASLLVLSCASAPLRGPEQTVTEFMAAFNRLDLEAVGNLLADDATAFLPMPDARAKITGKASIIAALGPLFERQRPHGPLRLTAKELTIQPLSIDGAVATFDVGTADVSSRRTLVLVRRGGAWRIAHLHASNVRPYAEAGRGLANKRGGPCPLEVHLHHYRKDDAHRPAIELAGGEAPLRHRLAHRFAEGAARRAEDARLGDVPLLVDHDLDLDVSLHLRPPVDVGIGGIGARDGLRRRDELARVDGRNSGVRRRRRAAGEDQERGDEQQF